MNRNISALCFMISFALLSGCARQSQPTTGPVDAPAPAANAAPTGSASPTVPGDTAATANANAAGAATATGGASAATNAPATKSGWWIRINPRLTTAPAIALQVGTNKYDREEWRVWRAGEPTEFDVPAKYQQSPRLFLRGSVTALGKNGDLCMMYKDRGVEHMDFRDDESETKAQTAVDFKCR